MEQKRNYQKELEKILERQGDTTPSLLLHACCAPCSSYCLEYLCRFFHVTVFFYNPNITNSAEYTKRVEEEKRLIFCYNREIEAGDRVGNPISILEGAYEPKLFFEMAKGLEESPEGGERCARCFELRLRATAEQVKAKDFDYFTTTLTISPLKNAAKLNEIGEKLAEEYGIVWLPSDFKKKDGYKRSIELSAEYDLYRQDYCGCSFSKAQREGSRILMEDGMEHSMTLKEKCPIIQFQDLGDERGKLVVIEGEQAIPFAIQRVFYMYGSDSEVVRGQHANRESEFVLINVAGKSKVRICDGLEEMIVELNRPMMGVYIPKMIWKDMYDFSADSVLLVLASTHYDGGEYIRDYDTYLKEMECN